VSKLTAKQQRFVDEYLIDLNAAQAAIRAGYAAENAEQVGYKLVHKSSVSNSISQAMAHRSRRTGITQDRVLRELAKVAFVNANDVIDPDSARTRKPELIKTYGFQLQNLHCDGPMGRISGRKRQRTATQPHRIHSTPSGTAQRKGKARSHTQEYINTHQKRKPVKTYATAPQETPAKAPAKATSGRAGRCCSIPGFQY
jgi:phage terminase small subunit